MVQSFDMASPDLKTGHARALRRNMTAAERKLWQRLRANRFLGLSFQRQEPVGPYIVDFYCSVARLVIELDGDAHFYTAAADRHRQSYLESLGMTVLRFPNFEVLSNTGRVLDMIYAACEGHLGLKVPEDDQSDMS